MSEPEPPLGPLSRTTPEYIRNNICGGGALNKGSDQGIRVANGVVITRVHRFYRMSLL